MYEVMDPRSMTWLARYDNGNLVQAGVYVSAFSDNMIGLFIRSVTDRQV